MHPESRKSGPEFRHLGGPPKQTDITRNIYPSSREKQKKHHPPTTNHLRENPWEKKFSFFL